MPYLRLLEKLVSEVPGAHAALLLDQEGERVVEAGVQDYRHRLIGAYAGIALQTARTTSRRYEAGRVQHIVCRYQQGQLILHSLKDGYYMLLALSPEANLAVALEKAGRTRDLMDAEL